MANPTMTTRSLFLMFYTIICFVTDCVASFLPEKDPDVCLPRDRDLHGLTGVQLLGQGVVADSESGTSSDGHSEDEPEVEELAGSNDSAHVHEGPCHNPLIDYLQPIADSHDGHDSGNLAHLARTILTCLGDLWEDDRTHLAGELARRLVAPRCDMSLLDEADDSRSTAMNDAREEFDQTGTFQDPSELVAPAAALPLVRS